MGKRAWASRSSSSSRVRLDEDAMGVEEPFASTGSSVGVMGEGVRDGDGEAPFCCGCVESLACLREGEAGDAFSTAVGAILTVAQGAAVVMRRK